MKTKPKASARELTRLLEHERAKVVVLQACLACSMAQFDDLTMTVSDKDLEHASKLQLSIERDRDVIQVRVHEPARATGEGSAAAVGQLPAADASGGATGGVAGPGGDVSPDQTDDRGGIP